MNVEKLPPVGRILGASLEPQPTPQDSRLRIKYESRTGGTCELEVPFLDAMYLLNILRQIEKDTNFGSQNRLQ
jgi:hypothetical protein